MKKLFYILVFLLVADFSFGQNKRYVEEIALYHLDSLTKKGLSFKYFTNGYLSKYKSSIDTTPRIIPVNIRLSVIKSTFKNLQIIEDTNLICFSVPKRIRRNGSSTTLHIRHFNKTKDKYFVSFGINTDDYSGETVLIIMNLSGDLIDFKYSSWIE